MNKPDYTEAHKCSSNHREQILESKKCGCFYCLAVFPPDLIEEWTDKDDSGVEQTVVCPYCYNSSVIGDAAGFPIDNVPFLYEMYMRYYKQ